MSAYRYLPLNEESFNSITPDSAYWIGFLLADGTINQENQSSPKIVLGLQEKDIQHLHKFRNFLESGHTIAKRNTKAGNGKYYTNCQFSIRSRKLVEALANYGVVPNKSLTANVRILENNRDFWRGIIDGDGSLHYSNKYPRLKLTGSQELLQQFREYAWSLGFKQKLTPYPNGKVFYLTIACTDAVKLADVLYADSTTFLDRKYKIYQEWLSRGNKI